MKLRFSFQLPNKEILYQPQKGLVTEFRFHTFDISNSFPKDEKILRFIFTFYKTRSSLVKRKDSHSILL